MTGAGDAVKTLVFYSESSGSNLDCDGRYAPPRSSNRGETALWCFLSVRVSKRKVRQ